MMNISNRTAHDVVQGTEQWLSLRAGYLTASEAPAALGVSRYVTRAELMRQKRTGITKDHSAAKMALFAKGHDAEAAARPLAEGAAGSDLFPVTMTATVEGLPLLASLDGLTVDDAIAWETKLWNEDLAAAALSGDLPAHYTVQMDQELLVSGAQRCLFTVTDGTPERFVSCWYEADPAKFAALIAGWKQFESDMDAFELQPAAAPAPVGRAPDLLPALRIELTGAVTASNLAEFKSTALGAIRSVNRELRTDADFADAAKAVKWCADVESRLKAAKDHALSQTADIDSLFRALDDIAAESKTVRLDLDKLVTRRKTEVKEEAVSKARLALDQHIAALNGELAPMRLQHVTADFAGAIKGLKSIDSMRDKLDAALAAAKIDASAAAQAIRANVATFHSQAAGFEFLFADLAALVHKGGDDFMATILARIAAHKEAEAKKAREKAEAEAAAKAAVDAAQAPAPAPVDSVKTAPAQAQAPVQAPAPAPAAEDPASVPLGAICRRFGLPGLTMTTETLAAIGFPAHASGEARLYSDSDFGAMCAALSAHFVAVHRRVADAQKSEVA